MRLGVAAVCVSAALLSAAPAGPVSAASPAVADRALVKALASNPSARVIVVFRRPAGTFAPRAFRARILGRLGPHGGFAPTARWDAVGAMAGTVDRAGLRRLSADPDVARVGLDRGGRGGDVESNALIRVASAHAAGVTGAGISVAVLDSGVDRAHPDLADSLGAEHCFVPPNGCPNGQPEQDGPGSAQDDHGHGTNVAGIVTANGSVAPLGVAPGARIVAVKVLDRNNRFAGASQIISALNWIALRAPDVRVVNMSLGSAQLFRGTCDNAEAFTIAFASAVAALRARGVSVFASSMNNASADTMGAPACVHTVVAVGAVYDAALGTVSFGTVCSDSSTAADAITCFSNSGSALDLLAPGAVIQSAGLGGGVSSFRGTSQASPHAAAAAALVLQAQPGLTPDRVEAALEAGGVPLRDPRNGLTFPRLDVPGALAAAARPTVADARVSHARLAFGRTRVGRSKTRVLTISNAGTGPLVVSAGRAPVPFAARGSFPVTVAPGSRARLEVLFRPRRARSYRMSLTLVVNDPDTPRLGVLLTGTGTRR